MKDIFNLLRNHHFIEGDEICQIAKGKYLLPDTLSGKWNRFIRNIKVILERRRQIKENR